ncbi:MspA family porin [Nocardia farcinica]|uniref:MspA family porin n=1 Tax=Nocardia farcinica TaxID=37329 RepID=UPI0018946829|nr:MspA family porin [Nocardia farcinica]MBF6422713.1 MspA family porin [Nocardia farcinica]MBF6434437.1 MspA family porin [Nocardia farcinica]MBF6505522.1 MspA family porin [Nocardia farcinica]
MRITSLLGSTAAAAAAAVLLAGAATADIVRLPDHERSITTADGWQLTVRQEAEEFNRVPPLNMTGTSREFFGSFRGIGTVSGPGSSPLKGAQIEVGWQVGCFVNLNSVGVGGQASIGPQLGLSTGPVPVPGGNLGATIGPTFTVNMAPGQIAEIPVASKAFDASTAVLQIREAHITVNGCLGPVNIRSYTKVIIDSQVTKDGTAVYGDPRDI